MTFLVNPVQIPAPTEFKKSCQAAARSLRERSMQRAMADIRTTNVSEPRAVTSTATPVSHGLRILATAVKIDESRPRPSCSSSSEVILTKIPNDNEAAPNHNDKRFSRAEKRSGLSCIVNPSVSHLC